MIAITNLNKFYKTRRNMHHALKDVSLVLPDKGMVFVLGKSGSGKSTFLNLIGGLDSLSSGQIVVDGNDISNYSEAKFVDYRNSCIGFIFQDHHLIDDLTLYQNIKLVLDLRHINDDTFVYQALEQVGLEGYENRYPRELSGGERQRVAIARAIVKRPRIILADEPTGNLDGKNAAEVMRILKELSKECLVLVVSHNTAEVHANADRIIELSEGRIISDVTRNPDYPEKVTLCDDTIECPGDRYMTDKDVEFINENISNQKAKRLSVRRDKFSRTKQTQQEERELSFPKTRLGLWQVILLSFAFLKTKVLRIMSVAIPLSLILLIILMSQAYINFDGNRIIADRMEKEGQQAIVLSKEISLDGVEKNARRYPAVVTDEDMKAFLATGYDGKTYPILSVAVPVTSYKNMSGVKATKFSYGVAATESLGTICVDEKFFEEKLGEIDYIAQVRKFDPIGVVITDYLADVILANNPNYKGKSYASLIGDYMPDASGVGYIKINAIIRTNYEERYKELIDRIVEKKETDLAVLYNDVSFQKLSSELYSFLAYSYTYNTNYVEDYLAYEDEDHTYAWSHKLVFDSKTEYIIPNGYVGYDFERELEDGQVVMGYKMYNAIFGTNYNPENLDTFEPHTANMSQYAYYDTENKNAMLSTKIEIAGLYNGDGMFVSENVRQMFDKNHIRQTGIYFDGLSHLSDILDVAEERSFIQDSVTLEGILTLNRCVMLFILIFKLVNILLCAAVVFIFISFSTKMIKDKLHEIGILKALGTDRATINVIFGLQIALIAVFTCLVSSLGYYFLIEPANDLFIVSLREMVPSQLVLDLDVLVFIPDVVMDNILLIWVLSIVSLVVPMSKIGRIRPVQIINTRD